MTLTTMTRKVKDNKGTSVIGGSILGLILSITLAVVFIQTLAIMDYYEKEWKQH